MTEVRTRAALLRRVWQLPIIAVLVGLSLTVVGTRPEVIGFLFVALATAELCRVDATEHRLPNRILLPGYVVAAAGLGFGWLVSGQPPATPLIACLATFGFLLLMNLAGGMGMGDVKLGGLMGLCLGTLGVVPAIVGPALGFVAGGVAGVLALLVGRVGHRMPFGPFLLGGFWGATLLGSQPVTELLG
jgi:leader peptidase (prepilin peptidase)/N-methyltransferase